MTSAKKSRREVGYERAIKAMKKCADALYKLPSEVLCTDAGDRTIIKGNCALYLTGEIEI